jgi:hypothetical protein
MRRLPLLPLLLALAAAAVPARAGIHYSAVTTMEGPNAPQPTRVEGWVDGPRAKIVFSESGMPNLESGQYMLTTDGGKTLFLVDPEEKTYAEWDLQAMLQIFGSVMESMQPLLNLSIDNVTVEKLAEESGGTIHGLPTTHTTFRTTYDMRIKVLGMSRASHVETVQDTWSTTAVEDIGLGLWLRQAPTTGFGDLDELVAAEMQKVQGFPLKVVSVSTTTGQKGKRESSTTTTTEVTSLDSSATIPASTFEVPKGYERVEMTADGNEEEPGNPLKGLFGGGKS